MPGQHAFTISDLWEETRRLNHLVAELQERLDDYEDAQPQTYERDFTPRNANANERAIQVRSKAVAEAEVWNVWPYSWGITVAHFVSRRFQAFQEKWVRLCLARHNKKRRIAFWQKPHPEEIRLKLM